MKKLLPVINGIALIATVLISYLSNAGVFGGNTMATVSAKYPTLFTPAGWAFAIWGLIYVGMLGFVLFHGRSVYRNIEIEETGGRVGGWFLVSCVANSCWVLAWMYEWTGLSILLMMLLLFSLLQIVVRTRMELTDPPLRTIAFVWWPFCLYTGWISVALIANIAVYLVKIGWNGWGIPEAGWAIIMILVAGGVHLFMTWKRNMRELAFVGVWALVAIALADKVKAPSVAVVAWVVAGVLCVSSMLHGYRNRAYSPFRKRGGTAVVLAGCLLLSNGSTAGGGPFPNKVHRIVFLGNSITYEGTYVSLIETYFIIHYPQRHFELINMGLPSETVSGLSEPGHAGGQFPRPDLHERLARVLALTKPDLVFVGYGMNDGIYLPFDEGRFAAYRAGMIWLHSELEKTGAIIYHMTPPVYDEFKGGVKGYDDVMGMYSAWLIKQRDSLGWRVGDIHGPMKKELEARRHLDSSFAFAKDGVHPDSLGHWIMAREILRYLGEKADEKEIQDSKVFVLVNEKQQLMKDAWLTAAGHKRPGMNKGLPLKEAKVKEAKIEQRIRTLKR